MGPNNDRVTLQFRYNVAARAKTNAYKPKVLDDADIPNARYTQFGACFDTYSELLNGVNARIVWEAGFQIHSNIILKPC